MDNGAGKLPEPGVACAHDASLDVLLKPFNGFRVVVTAMLLDTGKMLSDKDQNELYELGFSGRTSAP